MNKRISSLILAAALAFGVCALAEPEQETEDELILIATQTDDESEPDAKITDIKLTVGENLMILEDDMALELDVSPTIIDDKPMVPLRAIFEALGAVISWDGKTKTVFAVNNDNIIGLQIGQNAIFVNGEMRELDCPSVIVDDRTLVSVRAITEAFGNKVDYDEETKIITITD